MNITRRNSLRNKKKLEEKQKISIKKKKKERLPFKMNTFNNIEISN